jgi:hypothetical protein
MIGDLAAYLAVADAAAAAPASTASDWLTPLVGVATILQAGFAFFALRGLRDSRIAAQAATDGLKLTRETTERQLRAYVCYKQARHEPPASGRHLTCFVEFQNCGATPAYDVLACGTSIAVESVEGFQYPPPPASAFEVGSQTTLGPTSSTTLCAVSDEPLTDAALAEIRAGRLTVVVYGLLTYRDTFSHPQQTPFRLSYQLDPRPDGRLWLCSRGNTAT